MTRIICPKSIKEHCQNQQQKKEDFRNRNRNRNSTAKSRGTTATLRRNRVIFAEGWEKLTDEERAKLEIDIFKPLDFYEILFNRIKSSNSGKVITSLNELDFM